MNLDTLFFRSRARRKREYRQEMARGNKTRNGVAVLLAVCSNAATQPPRAWLEPTRVKDQAPPGATTSRVLEIRLMLEAGSAPVEVHTLSGVMPRLRDARGNEVVLGDWRAVAGFAPPQRPPAPQPPLSPGKRHVVCSYTVVRRADGAYHLMAPYGGADLPAGTYAITAGLDLTPTTREMWVAQFRAGVDRPTRRPDGSKSTDDPEQEAQRYAAHFQAVDGFFKGRVETPVLSFTLR